MPTNTNKQPDLYGTYRVKGAPGTGKTTFLIRQIERAMQKFGASSIIVTSFTKTAAVEIADKAMEKSGCFLGKHQLGTLHSIAYQSLNLPKLIETSKHLKEWNEHIRTKGKPYLQLSVESEKDIDDLGFERGSMETTGDKAFSQYNIYRNRMIDEIAWPDSLKDFSAEWEQWKLETCGIDFTDMLYLAYRDVEEISWQPTVGFLDEANDCSRLQLALWNKWAKHFQYNIVGGDEDQCQPAGTMILTPHGYEAIENLKPRLHRLLSYSSDEGNIVGHREGYSFEIASRDFNGQLIGVRGADKITWTTPNHKNWIRWNPKKSPETCIVYLMRQGMKFRVGWCQLFMEGSGTFHPAVRARIEKADALWILKICDNRSQASIYESYYAAEYGLPVIMFESKDQTHHYSKENIEWLFDQFQDRLLQRAVQLLEHCGRDIRYPLWTPKTLEKKGMRTPHVVHSCNLIPEIMDIPVRINRMHIEWHPLQLEYKTYQGLVYSLSIKPHEKYIADDIVTHNCIFSFAGVDPGAFLEMDLPEKHKKYLMQSHRCPGVVCDRANKVIRKCKHRDDTEMLPRQDERGGIIEGFIENCSATIKTPDAAIRSAQQYIDEGYNVAFLTTCSYMLQELLRRLKDMAIPFENKYRRRRGDWNPLHPARGVASASRLLAFADKEINPEYANDPDYEEEIIITTTKLKQWIPAIEANGILNRGAKKEIEETLIEIPSIEDLKRWFNFGENMINLAGICYGRLEWFEKHLLASKAKAYEYPLRIAKQHGLAKLKEKPQITVGTIHSVKGATFDVVFLFPDLSPQGYQQWHSGPHERDAIIRTWYVGITRAREGVVFCNSLSEQAINL